MITSLDNQPRIVLEHIDWLDNQNITWPKLNYMIELIIGHQLIKSGKKITAKDRKNLYRSLIYLRNKKRQELIGEPLDSIGNSFVQHVGLPLWRQAKLCSW